MRLRLDDMMMIYAVTAGSSAYGVCMKQSMHLKCNADCGALSERAYAMSLQHYTFYKFQSRSKDTFVPPFNGLDHSSAPPITALAEFWRYMKYFITITTVNTMLTSTF